MAGGDQPEAELARLLAMSDRALGAALVGLMSAGTKAPGAFDAWGRIVRAGIEACGPETLLQALERRP